MATEAAEEVPVPAAVAEAAATTGAEKQLQQLRRRRKFPSLQRLRKQPQQQELRSSCTSLKESGPFGLITNLSLNKAPLGVARYAKFTPSTLLKNFGVYMIKYSSPASCLEMLISTCLRLGLSLNGKIQSANGGKWTVPSNPSNRRSNLENMWLETLMALIGEQLDESDEICGVVASVRQRQDTCIVDQDSNKRGCSGLYHRNC
ncbi:hypothetical protein F3Y22_tig00116958pilonHSYRG00041 [Hibiscus syriacus]|uniref:Eukaryotic translation initiation factor isoform 4E n=1 Tax=Hibiscus syriacus TaxID=106335 RepID=A0A6A2WLV4_HIBSY|nr:hypothetical protein F3Y22_tig00116958pilonHSYRG00041 [Hibiscus syriacus]